MKITKEQAAKLCGKHIYAVRKDGSVVTGKLARIQGNKLIVTQEKGKKVKTKAILPLVLFDLLAIGTLPYAYGGGSGYSYGGYYGPYGYDYGYPNFFY